MASPTIPGYEGLTQIGKGGFSRVYRGEQAKLKRGVAIKVLNFGLNDEADRRSFERECELMGRVSTHPNIVTVHDTAFTENGQPCIVMEHYPGGSLADLITEVRQLKAQEVLEVGVAIAAALEASHQGGVLHCDLKPQNILISEFGQPALGDFGISTFSEERTRTGGDAGAGFTLAYAAPEIVEGASPSIESDVYSLAATLYTSLAGRRPFYYLGPDGAKPTAAEQARRILLEEPAPLTDFGVDPAIDELIRTCMSKDPSKRPSSAAEFAQSLYKVGRQLGLSTSMPRIATKGALPVLEARSDVDEPSQLPTATAAASPADLAPAPFVDDGTELRSNIALPDRAELSGSDDATALRVAPVASAAVIAPAEPEVVVEQATPPRSARRSLAPVIGLVSLLVVAGVLFLATQGDSDDAAEAVVAPAVRTPQAEVLLAPPSPQDVVVQRVAADAVIVSWSNEPADDVQYELRRDDEVSSPQIVVSPALITGVDPTGTTCFELTAIRGNRLSPGTGDSCVASRGDTYVVAAPIDCEGSCQISLVLNGFDADQLVEVTAVDAADGTPVEVAYDTELRTDSAGAAPDWVVSIDEIPSTTLYVIELSPEDASDIYRAVVRLSPGAG